MTIRHAGLTAGLAWPLLFAAPAALAAEPATLSSAPAPLEPPSFSVEALDQDGAACGQSPAAGAGQNGFTRCLFDDVALGINLSLRGKTEFGSFESYAVFARSSEGPMAPWRQLTAPQRPGLGLESTVALAGANASLLDDRVKLTSALGWSEQWYASLTDTPLAPMRRDAVGASAMLQRVELTLSERPGLRWSMSGEYAKVGEDFSAPYTLLVGKTEFYLPGERMHLATALNLKRLRLTASLDDYSASFGASRSQRFSITYDGLSLAVSQRRSNVSTEVLGPGRSSETAGYSINAEFDLASVTARHKGLTALLPTMLSLNLSSTRTDSLLGSGISSTQRDAWQLYGSWETPLGETSLGYQYQTKRYLTLSRPTSVDRFYQASHTVRWNGWRVGVDVTAMNRSAQGLRGFDDTSYSFSQSLAYSRLTGPEFSLRVGQEQSRMAFNDGSYATRQDSRRITLSLDLTAWLRKRLDRSDIHLRLDYRHRFEANTEEFEFIDDVLEQYRDRNRRQGILLTYGMRW